MWFYYIGCFVGGLVTGICVITFFMGSSRNTYNDGYDDGYDFGLAVGAEKRDKK